MFYCTECAKGKGWPVTGFRSVGSCEVCGKRAACCDMPTSMLPPAGDREKLAALKTDIERHGVPAGEALSRMVEASGALEKGARRMRLPAGGLAPFDIVTPFFGLPLALPQRDAPVPELSDLGDYDPACSPKTPPPPPSVPAVFRRLSNGPLQRWTKRVTSIDQGLRLHCQTVRVGFAAESATLRRTMEETRWNFPTFAPRARPFDWTVDAPLGG